MFGIIIGRKAWILFVALGAAAWLCWNESAAIRGELVARYDLARGKYVVLSAGLPVRWRSEYARLLRERYGIEDRAIAGCIVDQPLLDFIGGYDGISMPAVDAKFGHDVFKEVMLEASNNWALKHSGRARPQ